MAVCCDGAGSRVKARDWPAGARLGSVAVRRVWKSEEGGEKSDKLHRIGRTDGRRRRLRGL